MNHRRRTREGERGSVTPLLMGLMVVLMTTALGMFGLTESQSRLVVDDGRRLAAQHLAEAGVDHVIWRLRQSPDAGNHYGPNWQTVSDEQDVRLGSGTYHLKKLDTSDGVVKKIVMEGWIPNRTAPNAVSTQLMVETAPVYTSPFLYAVFGDQIVNIQNGETDSYDSRETQHTCRKDFRDRGNVGTNSTLAGRVYIGSCGIVKGEAHFPKGAASSVVNNRGRVTRSIGPAPGDNAFKAVLPPPSDAVRVRAVIANGRTNARFQRVSDNVSLSTPLPPGNYIVEDNAGTSLSLTDDAQLNVSGTGVTRLWLEGNANIRGNGLINGAELPPNLIIYGMNPNPGAGVPGCASFFIGGDNSLYAAVYAPAADIYIGGSRCQGSDTYGSIIGKTVAFDEHGIKVHYDEALAEAEGGITHYKVNTWTLTK